jgi:hypothetical protein
VVLLTPFTLRVRIEEDAGRPVEVLVTVVVGPVTVVVGPATVLVTVDVEPGAVTVAVLVFVVVGPVTVVVGPATVLVTVLVVVDVVPFVSNDSAPAPAMAATTTPAPTPITKFLRDTLLAFLDSSCPSVVIIRHSNLAECIV